ncbi:unnamed protein product [Arctogadus glacialis]
MWDAGELALLSTAALACFPLVAPKPRTGSPREGILPSSSGFQALRTARIPWATDADAGLVPRGSDATAALQPLSNSGGSVFSQVLHYMWSTMSVCCLAGPYWLGKDALRVSAKPFAENRRRLCQGLGAAGAPPGSVVLLQGGEQKQRYCTDTDDVFRQVGGFPSGA